MKRQMTKTEQAPRIRAIGYCRVSTDNQKEEGTIEIQEIALREFAAANEYELVSVFKDNGVSGAKDLDNRPGLAELFNYVEDPANDVNCLVIYKLDRLARDLYIQEHLIKQLEKLNVILISTKEPDLNGNDPMRKAFRQFMGIVSELEKSFITMRMSAGRAKKASKGGYAGGNVALGYKAHNKELKVDESSAETVKSIFHMKRYNRLSLNEIARELNRKGIPTARGGKWYARTIKYILENPLYKGELSYKDNTVKRADLTLINKGRN